MPAMDKPRVIWCWCSPDGISHQWAPHSNSGCDPRGPYDRFGNLSLLEVPMPDTAPDGPDLYHVAVRVTAKKPGKFFSAEGDGVTAEGVFGIVTNVVNWVEASEPEKDEPEDPTAAPEVQAERPQSKDTPSPGYIPFLLYGRRFYATQQGDIDDVKGEIATHLYDVEKRMRDDEQLNSMRKPGAYIRTTDGKLYSPGPLGGLTVHPEGTEVQIHFSSDEKPSIVFVHPDTDEHYHEHDAAR